MSGQGQTAFTLFFTFIQQVIEQKLTGLNFPLRLCAIRKNLLIRMGTILPKSLMDNSAVQGLTVADAMTGLSMAKNQLGIWTKH